MKRNLVAGFEELDRHYAYMAVIPFRASANLFTRERMMEMGNITVRIMKSRGTYWLFNNNCRAFVDIFLTLYLAQRDLCKACFDIVATDNTSLAYCYNYLLPSPFYFRYDGWWTYYYYKARNGAVSKSNTLERVSATVNSKPYDEADILQMIKGYQH